jgi:hypothetical protein
MKTRSLIVLIFLLVTTSLTACRSSNSGQNYYPICVDPYSQVQVPISYCQGPDPSWWYAAPHGSYYGVGHKLKSYNSSNFAKYKSLLKNGFNTAKSKYNSYKSRKNSGVSLNKRPSSGFHFGRH